MKTEELQRRLARLLQANKLLDQGVHRDAQSIATSVRADLTPIGDELTAPVSLAILFLEKLEKRIA